MERKNDKKIRKHQQMLKGSYQRRYWFQTFNNLYSAFKSKEKYNYSIKTELININGFLLRTIWMRYNYTLYIQIYSIMALNMV